MNKPYLTYEQQVEKLKNKNLIIDDKDIAIRYLKKYGYYSLICGYKLPFKNKTTNYYIDNTHFTEIVALYEFDACLRHIFLKYLLLVEKQIKVHLANIFSEVYSESEDAYENPENYDNSNDRNKKDIEDLINKKLTRTKNSNNYPYIVHAREINHNVPLWVLFNAISFGSISKMYMLQKQELKAKIAIEYQYLNEGTLAVLLNACATCRNVCAHGERLYTFKRRQAIPKLLLLQKMNIPMTENENEYVIGQKDLFSIVISLRYLLNHDDFINFKNELVKTIDQYQKEAQSATFNEIMNEMGFPNNWKSITIYRKI